MLRYRQAPRPYLLNTIYEALLDGERPLPSLEEVRVANSSNGLYALISDPAYEPRPWHDPLLARMRRIAPMGFVHLFGGYRLRSLYYEAFGDDAAELSARRRVSGSRPSSRRRMAILI